MPAISLPLRHYAAELTISERRQSALADLLKSPPISIGTKDKERYLAKVRDAITQMGLWDRFTDWALQDGCKQKALEALAVKFACDLTCLPDDHAATEIQEVRLKAIDTLFSVLSPLGMQVLLGELNHMQDGVAFQPQTDDPVLNRLCRMTLPFETAGKYLARACWPEEAANAYGAAARAARSQSDFHNASRLFKEQAEQWKRVPGAEACLQQAMLDHTSASRTDALMLSKAGHYKAAAEAFRNQARGWRDAGDFNSEADAWELAASCWTTAVADARAKPGGDSPAHIRQLQHRIAHDRERSVNASVIAARADRLQTWADERAIIPEDARKSAIRHHTPDPEDVASRRATIARVVGSRSMYWGEQAQQQHRSNVAQSIKKMAAWHTFAEWAVQGRAKSTALEAFADALVHSEASPTDGAATTASEKRRLTAVHTFLSLLTPAGTQAIVANPQLTAEGVRFSAKTGDTTLNELLSLTLPFDAAGRCLAHANQVEAAAMAFDKAGDAAAATDKLVDAATYYREAALHWDTVLGARTPARRSLLHFTRASHKAAESRAQKRAFAPAAVAAQNEAIGWRASGEYLKEARAWNTSALLFRHAAQRVSVAALSTSAPSNVAAEYLQRADLATRKMYQACGDAARATQLNAKVAKSAQLRLTANLLV